MKIGQFSEQFHVTPETIRFYINKGLLIPMARHGRYVFSNQDMEDMETLLKLKAMRFSLSDIHRMLSLKRLSNLDSAEELHDYVNILKKQKKLLTREKKQLEEIISDLNHEITHVAGKHTGKANRLTGVPLSFLPYLACPHCQNRLSISNCQIEGDQILHGMLSCACGYQAQIQNGIIIGQPGEISIFDGPDIERNCYRMMSPDLITLMQKNYLWMLERLEKCQPKGKLILEDHINDYCICHANFEFMEKDAYYILTDKFPEIVAMYKSLIDKMDLQRNVLYIAAGSHLLPLRERCIDIYIDMACNEYAIFHHGYSADPLARYFHEATCAVGAFWHFDLKSASMAELRRQYPENWEKNFDLYYFHQYLQQHWNRLIDFNELGSVTNSGEEDSFSYHIPGEKLYLTTYFAQGFQRQQNNKTR